MRRYSVHPADPHLRAYTLGCLAVVAAVACHATDAQSACNLIPVAERTYPSMLGGVTSPITAPAKTVKIVLRPCDASQGFEQPASVNQVILRFEPPGGGATTDVAIDPVASNTAVSECTLPGSRCRALSFDTPSDTNLILPPYGLAGPAHILVRDSASTLVAEIGQLFLPTLGCDKQPETVFHQFTVLPPPNSFLDASTGALTELLATVDGGGDLLVPFDYWGGGAKSVLAQTPGAPVAVFLEGTAAIPAMGAGDPNTIASVLAVQPDPSVFLRSFTLNGRPLPPLLRITSSGGLLGSADAVESVLRIARDDGHGGPSLYNLDDRLLGGQGPVVITSFLVARKEPVPLKGLASSADAVTFSRSEPLEGQNLNGDSNSTDLVAEVVNPTTNVHTNTAFAVKQLPNGYYSAPVMTADGDLAAFLTPEFDGNASNGFGNGDADLYDSLLRVFDADGNDLTASTALDAATGPMIDGRRLEISGNKVFFRRPDPVVSEAQGAGSNGAYSGSKLALSPGGTNVYLADSYDSELMAFSFNPATGALGLINDYFDGVGGVAGLSLVDDVAVTPDGKDIYTIAGLGGVARFARNTGTGTITFAERYSSSSTAALAISPDSKNVYTVHQNSWLQIWNRNTSTGLLTSAGTIAAGRGEDVTVSPDGKNVYVAGSYHNDLVVFTRNTLTGALTPLESQIDGANGVSGLSGANSVVVSPDGANVYVAGQTSAAIAVFSRNPATGALTFIEADVNGQNGVTDFSQPKAVFVAADGSRVYATSSYTGEARPLVFVRDPGSGRLRFVETIAAGHIVGMSGLDVAASNNGKYILMPEIPLFTGGHLGVVSLVAHSRLGVFDANTASTYSTQPSADQVAVAAERAAILTPEREDGLPLNGDADLSDQVAQICDATTPPGSVTSLSVAANRIAISDTLVAMTVPERGQASGVSRNVDGDDCDDVLAVFDIGGTPPPINLQIAADAIAVSGSRVIFTVPENSSATLGSACIPPAPGSFAGSDLNADGDTDDRVLFVYDRANGSLTDLYLAAEDFIVSGSLVAFRVPEVSQGGTDLNQNGFVNDNYTMFTYDLDTGTLTNTYRTAIPCDLPGCDPTTPYKIKGSTVSFLTDETIDERDLDGDGDASDIVLSVFDVSSRKNSVLSTVHADQVPGSAQQLQLPVFPDNYIDKPLLLAEAPESLYGVDFNGDGVIDNKRVVLLAGDEDEDGTFDDFDTCVDTSNPQQSDGDLDQLGDGSCDSASPPVCPPEPRTGCQGMITAHAAHLTINNRAGTSKDSLKWTLAKGVSSSLGDFGNPLTDAYYSLCVYDSSAAPQPLVSSSVLPALTCPNGRFCWKPSGADGYKMSDPTGYPSGLRHVAFKTGATTKISAAVDGDFLQLPSLPLTAPLTVQFVVNNGTNEVCWEAGYNTLPTNDFEQVKAKSN